MRIVRNDPYLTREDTGADQGRTPAVQHYEKQNGSDGAASNTVFTLSKPYVQGSNTLLVFVNGQKAELLVSATDATEYEETSSSTITFGGSLLNGDVVEFMVVGTYFIQDTDIYVTKSLQARENHIINGDCDIWQRAISPGSMAHNEIAMDRFRYYKSGTMVQYCAKNASGPSLAEAGRQINYMMPFDTTTADTVLGATNYVSFSYLMEGYDLKRIWNKTVTLSFWVKHDRTGIYSVSFQNSAADRSYVMEYTVNASNVWEHKTLTLTLNESSGTWNFDNSLGMYINFGMGGGSSIVTSSLNQWNSDGLFMSSNQVNAVQDAANDINRWAGFKLEIGNEYSGWAERSYDEELALCQRYYEKSYNISVAPGSASNVGSINFVSGAGANANPMHQQVQFKVKKRATPTVVMYDMAGTSGMVKRSADGKTALQFYVGEHGFLGGTSDATSTSQIQFHYTADTEL